MGNKSIKNLTPKQRKVLDMIYESVNSAGYPPSLADLRDGLGVSSNQSVLNFLDALENKGFISRQKGEARGIKILNLGFKIIGKGHLVQAAGESSAGPFIESYSDSFRWITLPGAVLQNEEIKQAQDEVFVIKVHGDSMINAGIDDGDSLLVKKTREFKSRDIVVARNDDGTTVKRFIAEPDGRAYLKPENPAYKIIPIYENTIFEGKVILNLSKVK